ncbi:major facilitator superfamily domain-containing protein [Ditylenchus destructor]|nr:major facilitator superfamily domain-containing protein [Ditylenchus destructor]
MKSNSTHNYANNTSDQETLYTPYQKTALEWSLSLTAMVATFPFSHWCSHHGAKYAFLITGILSALATALIPWMYSLGFVWMIALKIAQGIAYASDFAVMGVVCTRWASLGEMARFVSVMTCFSPLASVLTYVTSGIICDISWLGWPWVHYLHAFVSCILFSAWALFYTDSAQDNSFVTQKELEVIFQGKTDAHKHRVAYVPYKEILKSSRVWTVWLNAFADIFAGYFVLLYAPSYLNQVLGFSVVQTGVMGAIISGCNIPVKLTAGFLSDHIQCLSERYKLWLFNSIASICPAVFYVLICFLPLEVPILTVIFLGLSMGSIGVNAGGFYKCGALISRQYAEVVIAFTQFIKCGIFFIAPALMTMLVPDRANANQWHTMFYLMAISLVVANAVFFAYASAEPEKFTTITEKPSSNANLDHVHIK